MKQFLATTEDFIKLERSFLMADASAGSNVTLTLANNDGMAENTFIVVGQEGSERAELAMINQAVSPGGSVRVATLIRDHKKGEPITVYRYNKRKFYGALTATGSYVELTDDGSPVTIQVDDPNGTRFEYTGSEGYLYFKSTYYNSVTTDETDIDKATATLGDESARYASTYGIRKMAGFVENPFIKDSRIEQKRNQAENEVNSYLLSVYTLPLSEVPPLIEQITELLAAGYIMWEEYGADGGGGKMLGEARAILKSIANGTQRLIGADGTELATTSSSSMLEGYPNDSVSYSDERRFSIKQRF